MLETLVISVFVCGSLSFLIILFTKFFLRTESYDDMIAKRKEQENELLGGKSTKKEKGKKERTKVKKQKPVEDVGKPKAEVKPMVIEDDASHVVEDEVEEETTASVDTPRESTVSRRNKKKRRKNVSFSDDGEPLMNPVDQDVEVVKPSSVSKEQLTHPAQEPMNTKRHGKDEMEVKRGDDVSVVENGANKKKKKKNRPVKGIEEEIIEMKHDQPLQTLMQQQTPQQSQPQPPSQIQHFQQPVIQKVIQAQQSSPLAQKHNETAGERSSAIQTDQSMSKKKKKTDKRPESAMPSNNAKSSNASDPNSVGEEAQSLISVLELTPLSRMELKTMLNVLVEKGGPAITDPDEELQTQMRILRASEAAMRDDLLKERSNSANLNKSASERIQALNMKIGELQGELNRSNQSLQEYRQFRDENERLKSNLKNQKDLENRYKIVTDQFAINAGQLDSMERAKKALEGMVERLQSQIKTYEKRATIENTVTEQLTAAQNARAVSEAEVREVRAELEKLQKAHTSLCFENKALQDRAVKAEHEVLKLSQQKTNAESRGAAEGQEDPAHQQQQQRNTNSGAVAAATARQEQLEKLVKEKDTTISDLESQVQRLNQQIDSQREKNNVLRERNWTLVEEMKKVQERTPASSHSDTENEHVIALLRQELETSARIRSQLESRLTASSERLQTVQAEADKVARLSQSLRAKEKEVTDLQHVKETLESRIAALQVDSSERGQLKQQLTDRTADVTNLRKENEELRAQQARQKAASVDDTVVLTCLQAQVDELRRENELLKTSGGSSDGDKLQSEIETLRTKNNELREKNWKTVEALNAAQTEAERRVKKVLEDGRAEKRDLMQRIRQLESDATANEGWRGMYQKIEREKTEVEDQVNRYKAALSETETILHDLEQSVESEEKKWQAALNASEQECERARRELASVYSELKKTGASHEEITDLDFAYRCVEKSLGDIVDEMEEKLATAEDDLAEVTRQRDELAERLATQQDKQQLPSASTSDSTVDTEQLAAANSEVERLRAQLQAELKTKKELAQQNTKFSALVRIGQDALKEEQDLVKKLQLQLQSHEQKQQHNGGKAQNAS